MKYIKVNKHFQEALGEFQTKSQLALIIGFSIIASGFTFWSGQDVFLHLVWWKQVLVALLVIDIFAGYIANATEGTDNYYAQSAKRRWVFIAIHIHIIVLSWCFVWQDILPVLSVWIFTIGSSTVINVFRIQNFHKPFAIFCVGIGVFVLYSFDWNNSILKITSFFFLMKVVLSFSIHHFNTKKECK